MIQVIYPGDVNYENRRRVWNGTFDCRPAEIVLCESTADVVEALRGVRKQRLPVTVRAGGHSAAGFSAGDGGVVIDVRGLKNLVVDPMRAIAKTGAGNLWHEFDAATTRHGLATTGGAISTVGVAGFTLGGGVGWLLRKHGLACDNLISATMVTAEGEVIHAAAEGDADLYWALRGGAGNFGIVTELTFQLHPLQQLTAGMLVYPIDEAVAIMHNLHSQTRDAPHELTWNAAFITTPPQGGPFPDELRGQPAVLINLAYFGMDEEADRYLAPLRQAGHPLMDTIAPMPYTALQQAADATAPYGMSWDMRAEWLQSIDDTLLEQLVTAMKSATSPLNQISLQRAGGALAQTPVEATPFSFRHAEYFIEIISGAFPGDPHASVQRDWAQDLWRIITRWSAGGGCLNHLGVNEGPARVRGAFSADAWARLVSLKRRYDPENVFRSNANIPPAGSSLPLST